jgi:hypothetical protein
MRAGAPTAALQRTTASAAWAALVKRPRDSYKGERGEGRGQQPVGYQRGKKEMRVH